MIGYNLFVYAANNPVNNSDPTGNWIIKDAIKWAAENVVKPVVEFVQEALSTTDIVITHGYSANAAAIPSGSVSINLSQDMKGNIALQVTTGGGAGTPSAGVFSTQGVTFAPDVNALDGLGGQYGGSIDIGAAVGIEYTNSFDVSSADKKIYHGFNFSGGVGAAIPFDMHGEVAYTKTIASINVFDTLEDCYIAIMEW